MFGRLLVANRGEIAVRVMASAKRMGISTVAVYSDADAGALHVREAEVAVRLGPAAARESYLIIERVIAAAQETGAEAIHPGYGFLSENEAFAEACAAAGIVFVGPPPGASRAMGSKAEAKAIMERAGVPVVPGYHGEMQEPEFLKRKAYEIGYPVLIKATAGGGGKGMRRVEKALAFEEELAAAKREAAASFGDDRVLVERYVDKPRHIEIQIFADTHGRVVSLHERDCSVQRRHQKVIEEAPAPGMTDELRRTMGEAACRAAEAVGYVGAGTVEFIAEGGALSPGGFFFMEMNTRLQVEHPVTEAVVGADLVEWQLRVAAGEPLPLVGDVPPPKGHAGEVRLYAEDADAGVLPSAGPGSMVRWPEGARVDTGGEAGDEVSPHYDPMIAKIIVHDEDREAAFEAMSSALAGTVVLGPTTNLAFLRGVVDHPEVRAGAHDTGFVSRELEALTGGRVSDGAIAAAAARLLARDAKPAPVPGPWGVADGFRISGTADYGVGLTVDGEAEVASVDFAACELMFRGARQVLGPAALGEMETLPGGALMLPAEDGGAHVVEGGRSASGALVDQLSRTAEAGEAASAATAPMHGRIVSIFVSPGDLVEAGARLFAIEAMKMEHTVKAGAAAAIVAVKAAAGDQVAQGADVIILGPVDADDGAAIVTPSADVGGAAEQLVD